MQAKKGSCSFSPEDGLLGSLRLCLYGRHVDSAVLAMNNTAKNRLRHKT